MWVFFKWSKSLSIIQKWLWEINYNRSRRTGNFKIRISIKKIIIIIIEMPKKYCSIRITTKSRIKVILIKVKRRKFILIYLKYK